MTSTTASAQAGIELTVAVRGFSFTGFLGRVFTR